MIQALSIRFTNYLKQNISLSEDEQAKINYVFQLIVGDLSKLIIMLILFSNVGMGVQFLMATFTLMLIRPFTGGLHFKTYWGCLIFSIAFFGTVIFCHDYFGSNTDLTIILYGLGSVIFALIPISPSPSRPKYSSLQKKRFKINILGLIFLHFVCFIYLKHNLYLALAGWVIFIQALQLIISKGGFQNEIQNAN